ncbi:MAG: hypothetical protein ABFD08_04340 [Syntrophomonas sp.]
MSIGLAAGLAGLAGILVEGLTLYFILPMLKENGAVRRNYRGVEIPVSAGITFPLTLITVFILYALSSPFRQIYYPFLIGIIAISFLGFIDDMLGQRDALGFKGHFGALLKGRMTTGGLKAVGGGLIAFFLAVLLSSSWCNIILNTLLIALFTNMLNLLDLRPGRAIKGFLFFLVLVAALAAGKLDWLLLAPLLGAVVCYFAYDLKAKAMMGDAGSNVLGLALGYICAAGLSLSIRTGILVFLILVHIYTEKYSLTETIEKVPLLRAVDQLGRSQSDG